MGKNVSIITRLAIKNIRFGSNKKGIEHIVKPFLKILILKSWLHLYALIMYASVILGRKYLFYFLKKNNALSRSVFISDIHFLENFYLGNSLFLVNLFRERIYFDLCEIVEIYQWNVNLRICCLMYKNRQLKMQSTTSSRTSQFGTLEERHHA